MSASGALASSRRGLRMQRRGQVASHKQTRHTTSSRRLAQLGQSTIGVSRSTPSLRNGGPARRVEGRRKRFTSTRHARGVLASSHSTDSLATFTAAFGTSSRPPCGPVAKSSMQFDRPAVGHSMASLRVAQPAEKEVRWLSDAGSVSIQLCS